MIQKIQNGGYSFPPLVDPFAKNVLSDNGMYAYTENLSPLKPWVKNNTTVPLFNVSRETCATYCVPCTVNDDADEYVCFLNGGYRVYANEYSRQFLPRVPVLTTIVQDGVNVGTTTMLQKVVIVWQTSINNTMLMFTNQNMSEATLGNYLRNLGAINAHVIFENESLGAVRHGKIIYGNYEDTRVTPCIAFTIWEVKNRFQKNYGNLYHDYWWIYHNSGGGSGSDYDDTELRELIQTVTTMVDDINTNLNDYSIRYTNPFEPGVTYNVIGTWGVLDRYNERFQDIFQKVYDMGTGSGYDDTELRERITALETSLNELYDMFNTVTITNSSGGTVFTGTIAQALQFLYDNAGSGGDPSTLEPRVAELEDRLDTFSLSWQGEVIMTDTIENVSQWLYNYSRTSIGALTDAVGELDTRITANTDKNAQQDIDIANRAVVNHASSGDSFGVASSSLYGHVRLSATYTSSATGYALSRNGAYSLYQELNALRDRVTALENAGGGGGTGEVWQEIPEANANSDANLQGLTATGFYRSKSGYGVQCSYEGVNRNYGRVIVYNGWDGLPTSGLVTPTRAVVQEFIHNQSDSSASSAQRRIMKLVRYGYGTGWTQPSTLTWTPWIPIVFANYDGTTPS